MRFLISLCLVFSVLIIETSFLIKVGGAIGGLNTILFVILTAFIGVYLVRQQGFVTIQKLQQETSAGRFPALQIAEGVALLFAGALLLTPGFISDAIGFILLIPFCRRVIVAVIANKYSANNGSTFTYNNHSNNQAQSHHDNGNVIEGEYTDSDDKK